MTSIYLVRHSKTLKVNNENTKDSLQLQNEKQILSLEGEEIAKENLNHVIFNDIDYVYSSNYIRAISTAKYIAEKNNLEINIMDDLGERKFGISSRDELPANFERNQFLDENYKIRDGESQKEVSNRMYLSIQKILKSHKNKNIVIISHASAITYLLKRWCLIELINDKLKYSFQGKTLLEGPLDYCGTFKLVFDDNNNLINIESINKE